MLSTASQANDCQMLSFFEIDATDAENVINTGGNVQQGLQQLVASRLCNVHLNLFDCRPLARWIGDVRQLHMGFLISHMIVTKQQ